MCNEHISTINDLQVSLERHQEMELRLKKEIEKYSVKSAKLELENRYLRRRIAGIRDAIYDEGVQPRFHRSLMYKHRNQWPTLWKAIDDLIK